MPRWAQVLLSFVGVLVALAGALVYIYLRGPDPTDRKLGGAWEVRQLNSWIIDSGRIPRFLQRVHGRQRTNVAEQPFPYQYLGDDCVVFAVWDHGNDVRAACGDRSPVRVHFSTDQLYGAEFQSDPIRLKGATYSWSDIKQHAQRGEDF